MNAIIEKALGNLKTRIEKMTERVGRQGLSPQGYSTFEHELHDSLGQVGRAVEKAVLEDADVETNAIEYGGRRHYLKYKGPQQYECLFGKIEVNRSVYQANGETTVCPLEVNAGIVHHHLSPAAAEFVSYSVSHMVPREVAEFCRRWQFLQPCETVIKHVATEVGEFVEMLEEHYEDEIHKVEGAAPEGTNVVAFSRDGTCVNIRDDGWREAQAGSISFYGETEEGADEDAEVRRKRLRGVYVGQMPEEKARTFNKKFEREIERTLEGIPELCRIACIADGALSNWKFFENHALLKDATHINDFYHAAGYLNDTAGAVFGQDTPEAHAWFRKYRKILKKDDDGVEKVIRSIRYYKSKLAIRSKTRTETIRKGLRYFTRNRSRMDYAEYRRQGLPIGSGVVEAACKTLVGQRLKRAGMRWSIDGGQSVLNLRALVLSRRWDAFWKCHEQTLSAVRVAA